MEAYCNLPTWPPGGARMLQQIIHQWNDTVFPASEWFLLSGDSITYNFETQFLCLACLQGSIKSTYITSLTTKHYLMCFVFCE